jgi:hypothetical protein
MQAVPQFKDPLGNDPNNLTAQMFTPNSPLMQRALEAGQKQNEGGWLSNMALPTFEGVFTTELMMLVFVALSFAVIGFFMHKKYR